MTTEKLWQYIFLIHINNASFKTHFNKFPKYYIVFLRQILHLKWKKKIKERLGVYH